MKQPFLTLYDYGQGGVWTVLLADSPDEIRAKYPELQVVDAPPPWMSDHEVEDIRVHRTLDVDDENDPFLASLRSNR